MQITRFSALSQFAGVLQQELFPALEPVLGEVTDRESLFIAACAMIPFSRYIPCGRWNGRPSRDRLAIARAFLAKSVYGFAHTRQLLHALRTDTALRRLCGWSQTGQLPHESTFSRAFAEFAQSELPRLAHEAVIAGLHSEELVWHIARDSTAIEARERLGPQALQKIDERKAEKAKKAEAKAKKSKTRKHGNRKGSKPRMTQAARQALQSRIQRQLTMTDPARMLAGIPTYCDLGVKTRGDGKMQYWRGYKLHLDVSDGEIPIHGVLTSASVHDSQVAIPLMQVTSQRVTYLYDVMDSAYDATSIYLASRKRNHQPIIQPHTRPKSPSQLPVRQTVTPQLAPAQKERYKKRTAVERVFSRLKDEFGGRTLRVRGAQKVLAHLMFGVLAITVDQLLKLHR